MCELWSHNGICRVFGRPKLLEFVVIPKGSFYPTFSSQHGDADDGPIKTPNCGIFLSKDIMTRGWQVNESPGTFREVPRKRSRLLPLVHRRTTAPFPNLSLNFGIKRPKRSIIFAAAVFGILLQGSVFGYATWATFYNDNFYTDAEGEGERPGLWSFILAMGGTLLLVVGMTMCAYAIRRSSIEVQFEPTPGRPIPRIYWLQCGGQRVADQQFPSFAYSTRAKTYTTSWRDDDAQLPLPYLILICGTSLLGFVFQFIGLRGLHGSITLYQLACTLAMSIVRVSLRSKRFSARKNCIQQAFRVVDGNHARELDWQTWDIVWRQLLSQPGMY